MGQRGSRIQWVSFYPKSEQIILKHNSLRSQPDAESEAAVRIPTKKLLDFTAGEQLRPTRCILNMVDAQLIHCILLLEYHNEKYHPAAIPESGGDFFYFFRKVLPFVSLCNREL